LESGRSRTRKRLERGGRKGAEERGLKDTGLDAQILRLVRPWEEKEVKLGVGS
jgi:hypothetical protein